MENDSQRNKKSLLNSNFVIHDDTNDFEIVDDKDYPLPVQALQKSRWRVLVVDDDKEVHESTHFALKNIDILGKPVELIHAYNAAETLAALKHNNDIALLLLDVVMEEEDTGLRLVKQIRDAGFHELRIVLRTGQPGYAPEISVLREYDINDYRTKSELTQTRLVSLLTTSFRNYQQLHVINESRRGLSLIINSAKDIFKRKNLELFSQGVLTQLVSLLGSSAAGAVCLYLKQDDNLLNHLKVITAIGRFQYLKGQTLSNNKNWELMDAFLKSKASDTGIYTQDCLGMFFSATEGHELFVYVDEFNTDCDETLALLRVFAGNIAIAFENLSLIEQLDDLAYNDPVLKIPNRNALEVEFKNAQTSLNNLALVTIHFNQLSHMVSVFGEGMVHKAIIKSDKRLREILTIPPCFIATDGKSDLYVLCDYEQVDYEKIQAICDDSVLVEGINFNLKSTVSVVKVTPEMSLQTALRNATSALILAKQSSAPAVHYEKSMSENLAKRINMQSDLRHALENGNGLETYLQPKVRCSDGKLVGAEALSRWMIDGQQISPNDFIPLAEASGLADKISDLALSNISHFVNKRKLRGLPNVPIAVNQSMHELRTPDYAAKMHHKLRQLGLTPENIEFEITESVMMDNPERAIAELKKLRDFGYSVTIDDFGTGFSSLNYLHKLPVNGLKIDKCFIDEITPLNAKNSLLATSISIAERMKLKVVAEGIETKAQHDALLFLGCDTCQGFYFGKPMMMTQFDMLYGKQNVLH